MLGKVHRTEMGVSLAEILVALFILSAVGVAAVVGLGTTVKVNDLARTRITAESLARAELEYVISENYSKLYGDELFPDPNWSYTLSESGESYPRWDPSHNGLPWDYPGYTVTVSSREIPDPIAPDLSPIQEITASVRYIYGPEPDRDIISIVTYRVDLY